MYGNLHLYPSEITNNIRYETYSTPRENPVKSFKQTF